jgi:aminoglycoside 6'-N-acetyltransferase
VEAPTLTGEVVTLRPLVTDDIDALVEIIGSPAVARWWGPHDRAAVEGWLSDDDEIHWTVEIEGQVAGMIQASEELGPAFRHAGIDLFLAAGYHGRGLGAQTVGLVAAWLIGERGHHRLIIDPALANTAAIRCYESVGFRRVGVMRRYWYDHVHEEWVDGCLLDLLADELRSPADG